MLKSLKIMKKYLAHKNHHVYDRHLMELANYHPNDTIQSSISNGKIIV